MAEVDAPTAAAAGAGRHRIDREIRTAREYLKNGYKQIDFGNENAMEKHYAAARAASRQSCSRS